MVGEFEFGYVGVIDVLVELGILIDMVVGISIGVVVVGFVGMGEDGDAVLFVFEVVGRFIIWLMLSCLLLFFICCLICYFVDVVGDVCFEDFFIFMVMVVIDMDLGEEVVFCWGLVCLVVMVSIVIFGVYLF